VISPLLSVGSVAVLVSPGWLTAGTAVLTMRRMLFVNPKEDAMKARLTGRHAQIVGVIVILAALAGGGRWP